MGETEQATLQVLAEKRRSCRTCCDSDPDLIKNGSEFDFDPPVVSYWSQWLGSPRPKILIVGQDFGSIDYFTRFRGQDEPNNRTNTNLRQLLGEADVHVGPPPLSDHDAPVFLTNAILCLKAGKMNAPIKEQWVLDCSGMHLLPLIKALMPQIIVGMGRHGWLAVRSALQMQNVPSSIGEAAGKSWILPSQMRVFAVGHCSGLGLVNRNWAMQMLDWRKIGEALSSRNGNPAAATN